ncbi:lysostaphin resistance A-like protein [Clostridium thailandense]|uniref:CPBP family intramembrane glutamic endopeptidase n=1 Tax=Clostridium thailandense TaxID=2794346 RepID=UPI00398A1058
MTKIDIGKDFLVFLFVYLPPLIVFIRFLRERKRNNLVLVIISILYIIISLFTQNLIPFIFVLLNIRYLRSAESSYYSNAKNEYMLSFESNFNNKFTISNRLAEDYSRFKFSLKKLNLLLAIKYALQSYLITILISAVSTAIFSKMSIEPKQQEIVTWMSDMPLDKFLILIPVVIIFAPVLEEFVFRWLLFEKVFRPRIGVYLSAILSSILFAFIHFNLRALPILVCIGLYNCYLINKKGYWYSVFNHFTFNSVTTMVLLFEKLGMIKF